MQSIKMCELLEGWKENMDELKGSLDGFGSKKDPLNESFPEQNRIVS
jgi:hypothetical protein